jgi:hypothetical protein
MKSIADFSTIYILILLLTIIVFLRTIIDLLVENLYPTMFNIKKVDEGLVSNLVLLKHILDVPYGLIVIYVLFNVKLSFTLYFVIALSILSITFDYLFDKRYIYDIIDKKYLNQSVVDFMDIYGQSYLDYITLAFYIYTIYKFI